MPAIGSPFDPDQEQPVEITDQMPECRPGMCRLMILPPQVENRSSVCRAEHLGSASQRQRDER
jgi:hypothetical protein